mgnify:CR=1 FL=1
MHNKLFIADGAMAVFGGRNIANEYFLRSASLSISGTTDVVATCWLMAFLQPP